MNLNVPHITEPRIYDCVVGMAPTHSYETTIAELSNLDVTHALYAPKGNRTLLSLKDI